MKKFIHLALVLILSFALVFAVSCGGNQEENNVGQNGNQSGNQGGEQSGTEGETDPKPDPSERETPPADDPKDDTDDPTDGPKLPDDGWVSAIFGGGPFVTGGMKVAEDLKASGFDTVIIWSVHVHMDGTLYLNDIEACKDGELTIDSESVEMWKSLKEGKTSIRRIELSVGAAGCEDFEGIRDYIARDGVGEDTVLYRNMKALIDATGADAVNYDDESCYDVESAVAFGKMCDAMGVKVTFCPYVGNSFWQEVQEELGDIVDRVYVQCYAGGTLNDAEKWMAIWEASSKMKVIPGYWCGTGSGRTSAKAMKQKLESYQDYITGGFVWFYDDLQILPSPNSTKDYADAIESAKPFDEEQ